MGLEKEQGRKNFFSRLEGPRKEKELEEEVSLGRYLEMVQENPKLARTAHQYDYDAIVSFGVEPNEDGLPLYRLFQSGKYALYGIDETIAEIMRVKKAAAEGGHARNQVLLMVGPPSGGKSTFHEAEKWAHEQYSLSADGARYAIAGCEQHDDPLTLVPNELREEFRNEYGIEIVGFPCPHCQYRFGGSDWTEKVRVERVFSSEQKRVMIGVWWADDPKTQEISELKGSLNLHGLAAHGVSDHPEAYTPSGEFNKANRGLLELGEMLRADEQFLRPLHSLATERNFKVPGFGMIHVDLTISGHSNVANYLERLVKPPEAEGLRRRMYVVDFPMTLKIDAEEQIYKEKLLKVIEDRGVHISPDTYQMVAMWSVLTRLKKTEKADPIAKLRLYNGEDPEAVFGGRGGVTAQELKNESPREGMEGVPPTYVGNTLPLLEIENCLNPIDALLALKEGLKANVDTKEMSVSDKERVIDLFGLVRQEFDARARKIVQRAFVASFEDQAQAIFKNYLDNVIAYDDGNKLKDPLTGQEYEPDEKLMRSLEERMKVSESSKKQHREQFLKDRGKRSGDEKDKFSSYPRITEGIEKKLSDDLGDAIDYIDDEVVKDADRQSKRQTVIARLVEDHGYCPHCASHLIRYVKRLRQKG